MSPVRSVTYVSGPDRKILEPRVGVEPTTCRLRIGCSTTELPRPVENKGLTEDFDLPPQQYSSNIHRSLPGFPKCCPTWRSKRCCDLRNIAMVFQPPSFMMTLSGTWPFVNC